MTNFQFLSEEWKRNTEEERLLGVSLTGIMDNATLSGNNWRLGSSNLLILEGILKELRNVARKTNEEFAEKLGIPPSASITCVN